MRVEAAQASYLGFLSIGDLGSLVIRWTSLMITVIHYICKLSIDVVFL